jgi:tRNA(Ile)-lysidine synthase
MVSFDKKINYQKIDLIRPLLKFSKTDLKYIAKKIFTNYVEDPSNKNFQFKRVNIRNLIKNLEMEGLDKNKFNLTIKNLKFANESIKFFVEKNLKDNSKIINYNNSMILNNYFFYQPEEVVFRSLAEVLKIVGKKYYPVRGKKIDKLIGLMKNNKTFKATLGNCILKRVNNSIIVSKEH